MNPTTQAPILSEAPGPISPAITAPGAGSPHDSAGAPLEPFLTADEQSQLAICQDIIARGLETFVEVGLALTTIRDRQLYRVSFDTFEAWCQAEYGWTSRHARRLCSAAQLADSLRLEAGKRTHGSAFVLPANERQVRPLGELPPETRLSAWDEAISTARGRPVTEKHVRAIVDARLGRNPAQERTHGSGQVVPTQAPGRPPGDQRAPMKPSVVVDVQQVGDKQQQLRRAADRSVAELRSLMDLAGTADSLRAVGLSIALQQVQDYRDHLGRLDRLQEARPRGKGKV